MSSLGFRSLYHPYNVRTIRNCNNPPAAEYLRAGGDRATVIAVARTNHRRVAREISMRSKRKLGRCHLYPKMLRNLLR